MKINLIPAKKLALLSAAVCAVMLAFSHNASAVTLDINASVALLNYPEAASDADKTALVNHLIGQNPGSIDHVTIGGNTYSVFRTSAGVGPEPTVVFGLNGTGTTIPAATIGSGVYSYLWATYTLLSGNSEGVVWYIGNLSGDITIPIPNFFVLTGWTLFTAGGQGVPDGGTTVMLLGAALGALGMARRFLKA
jgi:hypothetical protein